MFSHNTHQLHYYTVYHYLALSQALNYFYNPELRFSTTLLIRKGIVVHSQCMWKYRNHFNHPNAGNDELKIWKNVIRTLLAKKGILRFYIPRISLSKGHNRNRVEEKYFLFCLFDFEVRKSNKHYLQTRVLFHFGSRLFD